MAALFRRVAERSARSSGSASDEHRDTRIRVTICHRCRSPGERIQNWPRMITARARIASALHAQELRQHPGGYGRDRGRAVSASRALISTPCPVRRCFAIRDSSEMSSSRSGRTCRTASSRSTNTSSADCPFVPDAHRAGRDLLPTAARGAPHGLTARADRRTAAVVSLRAARIHADASPATGGPHACRARRSHRSPDARAHRG